MRLTPRVRYLTDMYLAKMAEEKPLEAWSQTEIAEKYNQTFQTALAYNVGDADELTVYRKPQEEFQRRIEGKIAEFLAISYVAMISSKQPSIDEGPNKLDGPMNEVFEHYYYDKKVMKNFFNTLDAFRKGMTDQKLNDEEDDFEAEEEVEEDFEKRYDIDNLNKKFDELSEEDLAVYDRDLKADYEPISFMDQHRKTDFDEIYDQFATGNREADKKVDKSVKNILITNGDDISEIDSYAVKKSGIQFWESLRYAISSYNKNENIVTHAQRVIDVARANARANSGNTHYEDEEKDALMGQYTMLRGRYDSRTWSRLFHPIQTYRESKLIEEMESRLCAMKIDRQPKAKNIDKAYLDRAMEEVKRVVDFDPNGVTAKDYFKEENVKARNADQPSVEEEPKEKSKEVPEMATTEDLIENINQTLNASETEKQANAPHTESPAAELNKNASSPNME